MHCNPKLGGTDMRFYPYEHATDLKIELTIPFNGRHPIMTLQEGSKQCKAAMDKKYGAPWQVAMGEG